MVDTTSKYKELLERVTTMSTEQIMDSLTNEERKLLYSIILESEYPEASNQPMNDGCYKTPAVSFVFHEDSPYLPDGKFIALDNRTHDCWVEEFDSEDDALDWAIDEDGLPFQGDSDD